MSAVRHDSDTVGDINDESAAQDWQSRKSHYPSLDGELPESDMVRVSSSWRSLLTFVVTFPVLIQPNEYLLARLPPTSAIPPSILQLLAQPVDPENGAIHPLFCTVSRTHCELSILVSTSAELSWSDLKAELVPLHEKEGYGIDGPWRTFRIRGPMEFHLVGVLLEFSKSLARRSISLFVVSTWDTDYICVKADDFSNACQALREDGWNVLDRAT